MASLNKLLVIGNLGKDPEMRYMPSGEAVANFSVATTSAWTDKGSGERKEETEWHRCSAFGRLGEVCGQYLKKGSSVYIEGSLKTRKWQDKDGADRYTTEVRVNSMQMLGGKGERQDEAKPAPTPAQASKAVGAVPVSSSFADMDDDIPFADPYGRHYTPMGI